MCVLLALFLFCVSIANTHPIGPDRPVRPQKYMVLGKMIIHGLDDGFQMMSAVDKGSNSEVLSLRGTNVYCTRGKDYVYFRHPELSESKCTRYSCADDDSEPLCNRFVEIIPDVTEEWDYLGYIHDDRNGVVDVWTFNGENSSLHMYFVSRSGVPVMYQIQGYNDIFSAHPDIYVIHFTRFTTNVDSSIFSGCECGSADGDGNPTAPSGVPFNKKSLKSRVGNAIADIFGVFLRASPHRDYFPEDFMGYGRGIFEEFSMFCRVYGKSYTGKKFIERLKIFIRSKMLISLHNKDAEAYGFELGSNKFADMSFEEFEKFVLPKLYNASAERQFSMHNRSAVSSHNKTLLRMAYPYSVDWRENGVVNKPKDQGICGSCWAFATVGALESHSAIKSRGALLSFSEQLLLDCSWGGKDGNHGCNGGIPDLAYDWMSKNYVVLESDYEYTMADGFCKKPGELYEYPLEIDGYVSVSGGEDYLLDAVALVGPVTVSMSVYSDFMFYKSGIYESEKCANTKPEDLNHVVMLVGYGTERRNGKNKDYWLLRNSWGNMWGEGGYFRLARGTVGVENGCICGICYDAGYPKVNLPDSHIWRIHA